MDAAHAGEPGRKRGADDGGKWNDAIAAASAFGTTIIVNAGTYNQAVVVTKPISLFLQENAIAFGSLASTVSTGTVNLNGITLTTGGDNSSTQTTSPVIGTGNLVKALDDASVLVRGQVLLALTRIGTEARPAVPRLTEIYKDRDQPPDLRQAAARALKAIDPDKAKELGLR